MLWCLEWTLHPEKKYRYMHTLDIMIRYSKSMSFLITSRKYATIQMTYNTVPVQKCIKLYVLQVQYNIQYQYRVIPNPSP